MRPLVRGLADMRKQRGQKHGVVLDAGSGEGIIALKMAEELEATKIILVDAQWPPVVELPPHAEFHRINVESKDFLQEFTNKVGVVTCVNAFHEFKDPVWAAFNLFRILPVGGIALILDYSEEGWGRQRELALQEGGFTLRHYEEDMRSIAPRNLNANKGIETFWKLNVFPFVPGDCHFSLNGDGYVVLYFAM